MLAHASVVCYTKEAFRIIMRNTNKKNQGFTLIELLVVISIIAMISAIAVYAYNEARIRARNSKRVADVAQIGKGLEIFYNQCSSYPALPPATTGILITNTKGLYSGTLGDCNSSDAVYGANGVLPNGGFGNSHTAGANETLFIPVLPSAPSVIDDGSLTTGNKCSENNSQTGYKWGQYSYFSLAPASPNVYWIYFCIGNDVGSLTAGRYIYTERGIIRYTGNLTP